MASLGRLVNLEQLTINPMSRTPNGLSADGVKSAILDQVNANRELVVPNDERAAALLERAIKLAEHAESLAEEARQIAREARSLLEKRDQ